MSVLLEYIVSEPGGGILRDTPVLITRVSQRIIPRQRVPHPSWELPLSWVLSSSRGVFPSRWERLSSSLEVRCLTIVCQVEFDSRCARPRLYLQRRVPNRRG